MRARPGILAEEAKRLDAVLIHYSTDYVFDGRRTTPYDEDAPTGPLNVYGASKLEGECAIAQSGAHALVFRTSWVYGARGKQFPADDTEARAGTRRTAHRRGPVRHAELVPHAVRRNRRRRRARACRIWPSDPVCITSPRQGATTWHGFAQAIIGDAPRPRVVPIATSDYPTPARRPAYGVLSSRKFEADIRLPPARLARRARCVPFGMRTRLCARD